MKDDKKEVMGTEEPFEEQELIHTQDFESPEVLYQRLINKVKEYHPSDDISLIEKAYLLPIMRTRGSCVSPENLILFIRSV